MRFLLIFLLSTIKCFPQSDTTFLYLSIGESHYESDFTKYGKDFSGFINIPEANNSAELMGDYFIKKGAIGKTITSSENSFVTKKQIIVQTKRLSQLSQKLVKSGSYVVVLIYYCGHGLRNSISSSPLIVLGNITYNPEKADYTKVHKDFIGIDEILLRFDTNTSVFLFMDCCYNKYEYVLKPPNKFNINVDLLSEIIVEKQNEIKNRIMDNYIFRKNMYVATAANIDSCVSTFPNPLNDSGDYVGPICRRTLLYSAISPSSRIEDLVKKLQEVDFDLLTSPILVKSRSNITGSTNP